MATEFAKVWDTMGGEVRAQREVWAQRLDAIERAIDAELAKIPPAPLAYETSHPHLLLLTLPRELLPGIHSIKRAPGWRKLLALRYQRAGWLDLDFRIGDPPVAELTFVYPAEDRSHEPQLCFE
jgi:hypothetical protein